MNTAANGHTYRKLGELTKTHPETVRRYMQGQSPSVEFLMALCVSMGISAEWMLTGHGPMRLSEARAHALKLADPSELLSAVAGTIDTLDDRLGRLEVYVQTLESRVRGGQETHERGSAALIESKRAGWGRGERARGIGAAVAAAAGQRPAAG
ncbi:MAG: hypothetical protein AAF108_03675 [Planctomycetota bacterium]